MTLSGQLSNGPCIVPGKQDADYSLFCASRPDERALSQGSGLHARPPVGSHGNQEC